jgi:hypothetical protein
MGPAGGETLSAEGRGISGSLAARELVRDLIQRVKVIPTPRGEPVGLEIEGD